MTDNICRFSGDRDQAIVSYLYSDYGGPGAGEPTGFESHLATCDRCRSEVAAFEAGRTSLERWSPPGLRLEGPPGLRLEDGSIVGAAGRQSPIPADQFPVGARRGWREIPA